MSLKCHQQTVGWPRRPKAAPLCHGFVGVRLDQEPAPLLNKFRLRNRGPVTLRRLERDSPALSAKIEYPATAKFHRVSYGS